MNKESKLNLNASDYVISHCDSDKTYKGPEVHKMLCDAYIAGNNDTLDDKDEEIRKALINVFAMHKDYEVFFGVSVEDIRAWLKKQGEQKSTNIVPIPDGCHAYIKDRKVYIENYTKTTPADELEPKFHEGDWITNGDYTWKIVKVKPLDYMLQSQDGNIIDDTISHVDEHFHLWNIQDAKDGDVLASKDGLSILIFRNLDTSTSFSSYYNIQRKGELGWSNECFIPATKEQRDTLFAKMKEAGYAFDFEKKELKKIEQKPVEWSEEDETYLDLINTAVKLYYTDDKGKENPWRNELLRWLKSLKERIGG